MHLDFTTWCFIFVSIFIVILLVWIIRLEIKVRNMLAGAGSKTLDQSIAALKKEIDELTAFRHEEEKYLTLVEKRLKRSLQAVETVRFNPFKGNGSGGSQSFATAFVSEKGDGVVLSSLYAHDRMSVYSKPLANFASTYDLSEEEKEVLSKSKESLRN